VKLKKNLIRTSAVHIEGEPRLLVTVQGKLNEGDSPIGVEQLVWILINTGVSREPAAIAEPCGLWRRKPQVSKGMSNRYQAATLTPSDVYQ
jgi:hypothetical protein